MKIFRMHRSVRAASNYLGAMDAGGRWNYIGKPMLYTAQHLSLACVEILVHLDKSELPNDYVWSRAELAKDPGFLKVTDLSHVSSCQAAGDSWVAEGGQLAILGHRFASMRVCFHESLLDGHRPGRALQHGGLLLPLRASRPL